MAIRLVYLTTLEIMNRGERIMLFTDKWVLPSFQDATIIGQSMFNNGWLREEIILYKPEISEIKYFKLSLEGTRQLEEGRKWYKSLSLLDKIFIRFKFS